MAPSLDPFKQVGAVEAASETTPLLGASGAANLVESSSNEDQPGPNIQNGNSSSGLPQSDVNRPHNNEAGEESEDKPFRLGQILTLCYASLVEPVAYFSIFPYIAEMVERVGNLPKVDAVFWPGVIESMFSFVQMFLMIAYGRMSDRYGRRPVLLFSLTGISLATMLFGFSSSLWQMILFRMIAGLFSGSAVTIRTMVSENSSEKTKGRAFSWYMFSRNIGILIGPICGGTLADPARQFPDTLGRVQFFRDFPYALPSLVAGAFCFSCVFVSALYLDETLVINPDGSKRREKLLSTWEVMKSPGVPMVMFISAIVALLGLSYTAANPMFQFTPVEDGGLGFSPGQISLFLAIAGASQALWMLVVFPPVQRTIGTGNLFRITSFGWVFFLAAYPVMNELLRSGLTTAFWATSIPFMIIGSGIAMSYACNQLTINDISPRPEVLATTNALSLTIATGIRGVAPVLATSIYREGIKRGWLHGHLFWVVAIALALFLSVTLFFLPEQAEGRPVGKADRLRKLAGAGAEEGRENCTEDHGR